MSSYFDRVAPGEKPREPPKEFVNWSSQTLSALFCGMMYGGYSGLVEARSSNGALDPPAGKQSPFQNHRHRAAAYFVRGSILMGARVGSFVALLSGVTLGANAYMSDNRQRTPEPLAVGFGAGTACGIFAGAVGGGRAALGGSTFGVAAGFASGVLQREVDSRLAQFEDSRAAMANSGKEDVDADDGHAATLQSMQSVVRWLEEGKRERENRKQNDSD